MRELVSINYYLDDNAKKEIARLARDFPAELHRALQGIGFQMRLKVQQSMRAGGPKGHKWKTTSQMQRYKRLDTMQKAQTWHNESMYNRIRLKRITSKRAAAPELQGQYMPAAMHRWRGGPKGAERAMGKMIGGIRFKKVASGFGVRIGGLNPSMDRYLRAVQAGGVLQGNGSQPVKIGSQTITPAMRRLFFAAGIPLKKGRTSLSYPQRPLIRPVLQAYTQQIANYLQIAVNNYATNGNLSRDAMAAQAGFNNMLSY